MNTLLIDIETDGLDPKVIHCIAARYLSHGKIVVFSDTYQYADHPLSAFENWVCEADRVVAHNGCSFDFPVIERLLGFHIPNSKQFDTFPLCQLLCPQVAEKSMKISMPPNLRDKHSLKAWGFRLKVYKGDFYGPWDTVTDEMVDYCKQDVETLEAIYRWAIDKNYPDEAIGTEMELAPILARATDYGFYFDVPAAEELYIDLVEKRYKAKQKLLETFPIRCVDKGLFVPKSNGHNYTKGAALHRIEFEEFNPNSRIQMIDRLIKLYGWEPREFSDKGNPTLDEDVLNDLPYPEAQVLNEYMTIQKRIAQLIEGSQGWLKCVDDNGRIHGKYMQCGTLSGRASHWGPNIGQIPNVTKLYGEECRKLFRAPEGKVLVGVDMAGIEPRCFAGYLAPFDKGAAVHTLKIGEKDKGTDLYGLVATGINQPRSVCKTLMLAMMYGATNKKLGWIVDPLLNVDRAALYGKQLRQNMTSVIDGFDTLNKAVQAKFREKGYVSGLDKRRLVPRGEHAALNALLQSAGAVLAKRWLIIADEMLDKAGLQADLVAWVHDEVVVETTPGEAEEVKEIYMQAIVKAGEYYKFACPLEGEGKIGQTWLDIH